jgi:NADP-reducing hydrogenase subunit HndB
MWTWASFFGRISALHTEVDELDTARAKLAQVKKKAAVTRKKRLTDATTRVIVGTATCGVSAGARQVVDALKQEIAARKIKGVTVNETGCSGRCNLEPLVQVTRHGEAPVLYYQVTPEKARRIVQQHIQSNEPIGEWALT